MVLIVLGLCAQTLTVGSGAGVTVINNVGSIALAQWNVPGAQVRPHDRCESLCVSESIFV